MEALLLAGGKAERLGEAAQGLPKPLVAVAGFPLAEYAVARERFGFEEGELRAFTRTAVRASFADDATKGTLLNRITASDDRNGQ